MNLFGTDGIRGIANHYPITPEMGIQLGRAVVTFCQREGIPPLIVVGRDTRGSGDMLAHAVLSGILSSGGRAKDVRVLPTPAVAHLVRGLEAGAGIVITASHNPWDYNGFKIFDREGYKLSEDKEADIEELMLSSSPPDVPDEAVAYGRVDELETAAERYLTFLQETLPPGRQFSDETVVLDCANGATYRVAPALFERIGVKLEVICSKPDGKNINSGCGSEHIAQLKKRVLEVEARLGLAFDGDGDRVIAVDEMGEALSGDQILAICAKRLKEKGELQGNLLVSTVMSSAGFRKTLRSMGITHVETSVGDRHVAQAMRTRGAILGGEESGHLIFMNHHTTGDGLLSGLQLLLALEDSGARLSELAALVPKFPKKLINVKVFSKPAISTIPALTAGIGEVERILGEGGRVLVRYSGTEPLCRVLVEGEDEKTVESGAMKIADSIAAVLGQSNSSDSSAG
ncbi:MAG: phosphoglucosamine mutase [Deltaproteobacteria bacterium CG_4_8_14_3_um_filter_51_11]|nr:phosphoglucosamine mutase [bacterium]OIP42295.1 MAG: phosphoglucosamine mutase [Desulfobacteraceae bacterium CG2_30_51_40]PIP47502.1 MAG: phosphoglucosamine mutase [Deltaproteobacteria bacterium CG23_combo_of_CG06-09_8_20_14_all_51_20]PIX18453.1 MAG: phosphoglucosamine mutase [Deltaproteobacteria bacterium CG_4_8_14_3_um_filter_51_11]PIY22330.1 MAG: phosphoglucosamine mutase [Deltaproteobacteria bacterium CG_4_10_14_3_um_filter_51_14]